MKRLLGWCLLVLIATAYGVDLQSLIDEAVRSGARELKVPPGKIILKKALRVEGAQDLVINGQGASLVFFFGGVEGFLPCRHRQQKNHA